jgi:hypothetical protein
MVTLLRAFWNWWRYGVWTACRHRQRETVEVRLPLNVPYGDRRCAIWVRCTQCHAILARRTDTPDA